MARKYQKLALLVFLFFKSCYMQVRIPGNYPFFCTAYAQKAFSASTIGVIIQYLYPPFLVLNTTMYLNFRNTKQILPAY